MAIASTTGSHAQELAVRSCVIVAVWRCGISVHTVSEGLNSRLSTQSRAENVKMQGFSGHSSAQKFLPARKLFGCRRQPYETRGREILDTGCRPPGRLSNAFCGCCDSRDSSPRPRWRERAQQVKHVSSSPGAIVPPSRGRSRCHEPGRERFGHRAAALPTKAPRDTSALRSKRRGPPTVTEMAPRHTVIISGIYTIGRHENVGHGGRHEAPSARRDL
jgi:hypothetical protein